MESDYLPQQGFIARVSRVETIESPPYGRTSYEFDAIDDRVELDGLERLFSEELKPFHALRVVTTKRVIEEDFGLIAREGAWVHLEVREPDGTPGPVTFVSQLSERGYSEDRRVVLGSARLLLDPGERTEPPPSLGAAVDRLRKKASRIASFCDFPRDAIVSRRLVKAALDCFPRAYRLQIRDVGQANFVSVLADCGSVMFHFDAGWPVSFNGKTVPSKVPSIGDGPPVILSHWDWDHMHAFHNVVALREVAWLTPVQPLGPGAMKVAVQLKSAGLLFGYSGRPIPFRGGRLMCCRGPNGSNDTGLALELKLKSGKTALLVGDACYNAVPTRKRYDLLVATHHGANFDGHAPFAKLRGSPCVISVGRGNVYRHPRCRPIGKHRLAGWKMSRTSAYNGIRRGDRFLGP